MNNLNSKRMTDLIVRAREVIEKQLEESLYTFESEDPKQVFEDSDGEWSSRRLGPAELLQKLGLAHDQLAILNEIQSYTSTVARGTSPTEEEYVSAMQKLIDKIGPANTAGE